MPPPSTPPFLFLLSLLTLTHATPNNGFPSSFSYAAPTTAAPAAPAPAAASAPPPTVNLATIQPPELTHFAPCARTCDLLINAGVTSKQCKYGSSDFHRCLCNDPNFHYGVRDCAYQHCAADTKVAAQLVGQTEAWCAILAHN